MSEPIEIPEAVLRRRLDAFEEMRRFFIDMWLQSPALAAQAGPRIQALLRPLPHPPEADPKARE